MTALLDAASLLRAPVQPCTRTPRPAARLDGAHGWRTVGTGTPPA